LKSYSTDSSDFEIIWQANLKNNADLSPENYTSIFSLLAVLIDLVTIFGRILSNIKGNKYFNAADF